MVIVSKPLFSPLVTDKDLPESDGKPMENLLESPQSQLLTIAVTPVLDRIHGTGQYLIGADSGIYWRLTDPPLDGCKAPDWYFVPDVPQARDDGDYRRSYVLWNEQVPPYLVVEYVSGDGSAEHDRTPNTGKFWVYERAIRAECYVIYDPASSTVEVYERVRGRFRLMRSNERGHYELPEMEVELGLWHGAYRGVEQTWLRFYNKEGQLLPNDLELAVQRDEAVAQRDALAAELVELKKKLRERRGDDSQPG